MLEFPFMRTGARAEPEPASPLDKAAQIERTERSATLVWWAVIGTCVVLTTWAALSPLDVVSVAEGTVAPSSRIQKVQHLEGGIILDVLVREGERVEKDQVLVRLEPTRSHADFGEVDARLTSLRAEQMRLEAEAAGRATFTLPKDFAAKHADVAERTEKLFLARRATLTSNIQTNERQIEEISARLEHTRSRYALAREQVDIGNRLLKEGLSNRYEQIEREKEANGLLSRIREDEAALGKARSQLAALRGQYDEDVRRELSEIRRQLEELASRETKFRDAVDRNELKAPMAGIVQTLYVNNVGAVLPQGGTVLDLVPVDDRLVVEARLPPQDVGFVHPGQRTVVQLASSEATRLGRIEGRVIHVSPDSVNDQQTRQNYYLVRIETETSSFHSGNLRYDLSPGVLVTAGIVTGRRSVLTYLLYPVFRTTPFALGER